MQNTIVGLLLAGLCAVAHPVLAADDALPLITSDNFEEVMRADSKQQVWLVTDGDDDVSLQWRDALLTLAKDADMGDFVFGELSVQDDGYWWGKNMAEGLGIGSREEKEYVESNPTGSSKPTTPKQHYPGLSVFNPKSRRAYPLVVAGADLLLTFRSHFHHLRNGAVAHVTRSEDKELIEKEKEITVLTGKTICAYIYQNTGRDLTEPVTACDAITQLKAPTTHTSILVLYTAPWHASHEKLVATYTKLAQSAVEKDLDAKIAIIDVSVNTVPEPIETIPTILLYRGPHTIRRYRGDSKLVNVEEFLRNTKVLSEDDEGKGVYKSEEFKAKPEGLEREEL